MSQNNLQPIVLSAASTEPTSQISTATTTHNPTSSEGTAKLWIAYQLRNGCGYLHAFEVNLLDSNATVVTNLRKWILDTGALGGMWSRLMRKFVIETALVDFTNVFPGGSTKTIPTPVNLHDHKPNAVLSRTFRNPFYMTDSTSSFISEYQNLLLRDGQLEAEVLVIRTELDKLVVLSVLLGVLLVACALGGLVGGLVRNAETGIGVTFGVFGLLSFVQATVAWFEK